MGGWLAPERAILCGGAGRGVHFCERLQGLEPVWGIVVLNRVHTVATGGWDPCNDGWVHPPSCAVPAEAVRNAPREPRCSCVVDAG